MIRAKQTVSCNNHVSTVAMFVVLGFLAAGLNGFTEQVAAASATDGPLLPPKTMHLKLRRDVVMPANESLYRVLGCSLLPPVPYADGSLFRQPTVGSIYEGVDIDIYWTASRIAVYEKGARYTLHTDCTWVKSPIDGAEIYDYSDRSIAYLIDFPGASARKGHGTYFFTPAPVRLRKEQDMAYQKQVTGHDTIASQRCDIVRRRSAKVESEFCKMPGLTHFPNTGNEIVLRASERGTVTGWTGERVRRMEAKLVEINVPIPEEKFKVPAGFQITK